MTPTKQKPVRVYIPYTPPESSIDETNLKEFAYDKRMKIAAITKSPKFRALFDTTAKISLN